MCSEIISAHCTSKRQNGPGKQMGNYNSNNLDDGSGGYVLRHIEMCTIGHEILIAKRRSIILENISESSVGLKNLLTSTRGGIFSETLKPANATETRLSNSLHFVDTMSWRRRIFRSSLISVSNYYHYNC